MSDRCESKLNCSENIENSPDSTQEKLVPHGCELKAAIAASPTATPNLGSSTELLANVEELLKVSKLEEAVEKFGFYMEARIKETNDDPMNPTLAEDYARYGSLLLRFAIKNNDRNLVASKSDPAAAENAGEISDAVLHSVADGKNKCIQLEDDVGEDEDEAQDEDEDEGTDGEEEDNLGKASAYASQDGNNGEDDFSIAWENLDLARILFESRLNSQSSALDPNAKAHLSRSLAQVFQELGDLSLENENFDQAIQDYQSALTHFGGSPGKSSLRDVAGVYFNLALCMEFLSKIDESRKMYICCKEYLKRKEDQLVQSAENEAASESRTPELMEIRELIQDVSLKIDDLEVTNQATLSAAIQNATNIAAVSAAQNLSGASFVNDLSSLIKKRKAEPPQTDDPKTAKVVEEPHDEKAQLDN